MSESNPTLKTNHLLVCLRGAFPSGYKSKRKESVDIAEKYKVKNSKRIKLVVDVFSNSELQEAKKHAANCRNWLHNNTLAWDDAGWRLVSNLQIVPFRAKIEADKEENNRLFEAFIESFEGLKEKDEAELADLYDPTVYPTVEQLREKYEFRYDWGTVPNPEEDVRVGSSPEQVEYIKQSLREQEERKVRRAAETVTKRLAETIGRFHERMGAYDGTRNGSFKDSLVQNVRDIAELLPSFNVYNDPKLDEIRSVILRDLAPLDPDDLRKDKGLREEARVTTKNLLDRIGAFGREDVEEEEID